MQRRELSNFHRSRRVRLLPSPFPSLHSSLQSHTHCCRSHAAAHLLGLGTDVGHPCLQGVVLRQAANQQTVRPHRMRPSRQRDGRAGKTGGDSHHILAHLPLLSCCRGLPPRERGVAAVEAERTPRPRHLAVAGSRTAVAATLVRVIRCAPLAWRVSREAA